MRLIRFRPLKNGDDLNHLKETIKKNQFYCSNFLDMNDPMEGVFTTTDIANINNVFSGKNSFKICSFTGDGSLNNPLLWGYYANGFKGAAIEVEVRVSNIKEIIKNKKGIIKVNYVEIVDLCLWKSVGPGSAGEHCTKMPTLYGHRDG